MNLVRTTNIKQYYTARLKENSSFDILYYIIQFDCFRLQKLFVNPSIILQSVWTTLVLALNWYFWLLKKTINACF